MEEKEFLVTLQQPVFTPYHKEYQMAYFRIDNINILYENKIHDHTNLKQNLQDLIKETIPFNIPYLIIFLSNHSGILLRCV